MTKEEIKILFENNKKGYLFDLLPSSQPIAFLLGGQGACGKGQLIYCIQKDNNFKNGLFSINGDLYRKEHPRHEELAKSPESYSSETQLFSNIFTEGFIEESIKRKLNVSVEGTMRNPNTPITTASLFRKNGYKVEAYVIAAPAEFSSLNLYTRYANELTQGELGRLADKSSHDAAAEMMPVTLDVLYNSKAVDAIHIYSCFAKDKVGEYHLIDGIWDNKKLPSKVILKSRDIQRTDISTMQRLIERSSIIESVISNPNVLNEVQIARDNLNRLIKEEKAVQTIIERTKNSWARQLTNEQLFVLKDYVSTSKLETTKEKFDYLWVKAKTRLEEQNINKHWQENTHKELIDLSNGITRDNSLGWHR